MTWQKPEAFYLLILLLPAVIYQWRKRPPTLKISSIAHFGEGQSSGLWTRYHWLVLLESLAAILIIIAMARPQKGIETFVSNKEGIDIMLTLDLSGSMNYYDPKDGANYNDIARAINKEKLKDRLETAKEELQKFIESRPNDRIGLVVFGVKAYIDSPPTLDHDYLSKKIAHLKVKNLGEYAQGTNIADALLRSINTLKDLPTKRKVMVLFTDGENTIPDQLTPSQASKLASDYYITIHTVGIGSNNPIAISRGFGGSRLVSVDSVIDEPLLKEIASNTGGQFFYAKAQKGFAKVMEEINKIEKVVVKQPSYTNYKELYPPFLYTALALLCLSFILSKALLMRIP